MLPATRHIVLLALCLLLLPATLMAGEVTRDEALGALWTDWKFSLQNNELLEVQADLADTPGREYVIGWIERDNPDMGPALMLAVVYSGADGPAYLMTSLPVEGDTQYSLCGADVMLEPFGIEHEFAQEMALAGYGRQGIAVDDGMCDRIYLTTQMSASGPELVLSRR